MQLTKPSPSQNVLLFLNQERQKKNRRCQQNKHQRVYYCFLFYSHREPLFPFSFMQYMTASGLNIFSFSEWGVLFSKR
jgi:hypothetical protein